MGDPKAPTEVIEYFSLTCTHCAAFANDTFPEVEQKLINTGKVRWVFRDFPLDRLALQGEMVARALPLSEYPKFLLAMFASQDRWAFAPEGDPENEVEKMALLAGLDKATFDAAWNDAALRNWILANQEAAQKQYGIDSTPTFIINGQKHPGEMSYDEFAKLIPNA
jgi:protein-disulfide isomerase